MFHPLPYIARRKCAYRLVNSSEHPAILTGGCARAVTERRLCRDPQQAPILRLTEYRGRGRALALSKQFSGCGPEPIRQTRSSVGFAANERNLRRFALLFGLRPRPLGRPEPVHVSPLEVF